MPGYAVAVSTARSEYAVAALDVRTSKLPEYAIVVSVRTVNDYADTVSA